MDILPQSVNNIEETLISHIKCHPISADELRKRFEKVKRNINFDQMWNNNRLNKLIQSYVIDFFFFVFYSVFNSIVEVTNYTHLQIHTHTYDTYNTQRTSLHIIHTLHRFNIIMTSAVQDVIDYDNL